MRLLAVVMSGAVVAGAAGWPQTQRSTHEQKTAPASAPASPAVDKGARWLASVCERAQLPVVLMQTDASTSVAAFLRLFMIFLSGERESRGLSSSLSIASELILDPAL